MKQLNEHHSFTGMQRDMSIAKHPSSFLYDAHNIRLTARGEDTLLTITNEKGPSYAGVEIKGTYLGHCLLGKYLTVFSTGGLEEDDDTLRDYITRIDLSTKESVVLYKGNLKFNASNPIETIGSYENSDIQKVYWTDGINQPRLINIVDDNIEHTDCDTQFDFIRELSLQEDVTIQKQLGSSGSFAPGVIQYAFTYYNKFGQETNIFYTSPLLYVSHKDRGGSPEDKVENAFRITVANIDKSFDYLRIYSIQRTSLNAVPIVKRVQDISTKADTNRSESKLYEVLSTNYTIYNDTEIIYPQLYSTDNCDFFVPNSKLAFPNLDSTTHWWGFTRENYPNLQIRTPNNTISWGDGTTGSEVMWVPYEMRTDTQTEETGNFIVETWSSENLQKVNLRVYTDPLKSLSFLDVGTSGDSIDPTELLYKGGESLIAQTIEQKDNTLFLGNIRTERKFLEDSIKNDIQSASSRIGTDETRIFYPTVVTKGDYVYHNQLTSYSDVQHTKSVPCAGFKRGDYYRCGIQFQYKDGRWSDPIFLNDEQVTAKPSLNTSNDTISVPVIKYAIHNANSTITNLYNLGYRKIRPVVVFPSLQDRVTICQGVTCPTLFMQKDSEVVSGVRIAKKGQSSWFFRPTISSGTYINNNSTISPRQYGLLEYADAGYVPSGTNQYIVTDNNPDNFRSIEIQGHFEDEDKFMVNTRLLSLHSPDAEFDDSLSNLNFEDTEYRKVGIVSFYKTFSDINIQTDTPQISNSSYGFIHKSFSDDSSYGIVAGLFYEDFCIDDNNDGSLVQLVNEKSSFEWVVYPWQRNGSLNNDITRPTDKGTATSVLKKKVISNLRYANTTLDDVSNWLEYNTVGNAQLYDSDQPTVVKVNGITYQGNIDTSLYPNKTDGMYYAFNGRDPEATALGDTAFNISFTTQLEDSNHNSYYPFWKTFSIDEVNDNRGGLWRFDGTVNVGGNTKYKWKPIEIDSNLANKYIQLVRNKQAVRMRYKSSPHLVINTENGITYSNGLPIVEVIRKGDDNSSYYRRTMFGGTSEDALKANVWVPCGEPVNIPPSMPTNNSLYIEYSYGDTYFQRWDCLKTYPFSNDDINQIVEIGSFMLETRVNIDGRYDRNRGQISNLNMSPINFNLFNPVYNQVDNFFTYRILDESYYKINRFPNQITWTKEKQSGADVDLWTNLTLASTYDMDGSKGEVRSLQTWRDNIYCFQDLGISTILFNSRVQIPTSDGVPIEITNSYKVDGYRYISDGIGCKNKWSISNTPSGMYFADTKNNHLFHVGDQMQDISTVHNMTSWFNDVDNNSIQKTLYDDVNHDLYVLTNNTALCYSEILGNFTSFMDYNGILLLESYGNHVYTMNDNTLYTMFEGQPNDFFGVNKTWDFTFISNGIENQLMDFDKIFTNIDYRMDMFDGNTYIPDRTLDTIQVTNEYQDTGEVDLQRVGDTRSFYHKDSNLQKKFKIWRIQIPRNSSDGRTKLDRIRNPWCKIKLGSKLREEEPESTENINNLKVVLYDLNVQYYL